MEDIFTRPHIIRISLDPEIAEVNTSGNYILRGNDSIREVGGIEVEYLVDESNVANIGIIEAVKIALCRFDKTKGVKTIKVV